MKIFSGREHATKIESKLKDQLIARPCDKVLAIVQVGNNKSSSKYIELKVRLCKRLGIECEYYRLEESYTDNKIASRVRDICNDGRVGGVIIQLPLPRNSLNSVLNIVPVNKDIDLLSSNSLEQFYKRDFSKLSPVVRSLKYFLDENSIEVKNTRCTIIGQGVLVGKPVGYYLRELGADVSYMNKYDTGQKLNCNLLVLSSGVPNLVNRDDISPKCNVVDYGSAVLEGKTVGDLNKDSKLDHLGVVALSPGGMGPIVVRMLVQNFLDVCAE